MNDTNPKIEHMLRERYAAMTSTERILIACSMRAKALAIIESSLPAGLSREERRYQIAKRFYGDELPEAALRAHAQFRSES
jgi:hypothetical protein